MRLQRIMLHHFRPVTLADEGLDGAGGRLNHDDEIGDLDWQAREYFARFRGYGCRCEMTNIKRILIGATLCILPVIVFAQGPLNPADLLKPLGESWPTYSGDYSGKRWSSLTQVNQTSRT